MSLCKVMVVGQVPPPFGGQAIMIEKMLAMKQPGVELIHVPMEFSRDMGELGKFQYRKLLVMVNLVARIILTRFTKGTKILCYPPAGPPRKVPVYRDLFVLLLTRWLFPRTVWYFHACGLSEWMQTFPPHLRFLCRLAYNRPSAVVSLSEFTPPDGPNLKADKTFYIPYGIEDTSGTVTAAPRDPKGPVVILFVGVMMELKGVMYLLEAARLLRDRGLHFRVDFMGQWESPEFQREVEGFIATHKLEGVTRILGVQTGARKFQTFAESDIFTLPSHHDSESFGLVAVEAMCFGLPVVATRWRGLRSIVEEEKSGILVPKRDGQALADAFGRLIQDADLRQGMGARGRERFTTMYTIPRYHENVAGVFKSV